MEVAVGMEDGRQPDVMMDQAFLASPLGTELSRCVASYVTVLLKPKLPSDILKDALLFYSPSSSFCTPS